MLVGRNRILTVKLTSKRYRELRNPCSRVVHIYSPIKFPVCWDLGATPPEVDRIGTSNLTQSASSDLLNRQRRIELNTSKVTIGFHTIIWPPTVTTCTQLALAAPEELHSGSKSKSCLSKSTRQPWNQVRLLVESCL